jgi:Cell shape-determining protein
MQPSRDDFVIAIRSAFLSKSAQQRFSLLLLIFFSLILISLSKFNFKAIDYVRMSFKEIAYRSSFIVSIPEKYIKIGYYSFKDHLKLYQDYKNTKFELEILKSKELNNKYIIAENKRLKETIEEIKFSNEDVYAKVLLDKDSPFLKSFIINKGSKQKIKLGMAVLDKGYLVGKIIEVNFSTSRVLLLTDLNSKIPINIEPGGIQSIMSGTGKEYGEIQYF